MPVRNNGHKMKTALWLAALGGLVAGACVMVLIGGLSSKTSTNEYCMSCHYHEQADANWKRSPHYLNSSGTATDCIECHLPPKENGYLRHYMAKARMGAKDVWVKMTRDKDEIDWEAKRQLERATKYTYNASCEKCHVNLYPQGISDEGITAHLYYDEYAEKLKLQCISCHLNAGHEIPGYSHKKIVGRMETGGGQTFTSAAQVTAFEDFTETVPRTDASLRMIAVPGGEFILGSTEKEAFRASDEGPARRVRISPFFMGETEVSWQQYWAFYNETMSEGRTPPELVYANNSRPDVDAVSGPTPPFGLPDQGWGMGQRPAITMTHYAAETFCQWLSLKTGRHYRLPTEAEWEYAAKAGTTTPYFFGGDPRRYSGRTLRSRLLGRDTTMISRYVVYDAAMTLEPSAVKANPFGLKNMLGNAMEYCSDWYSETAYADIADGGTDPRGPSSGSEHVVRGGCFEDDAALVRASARSHTVHDEWLRTDPQNPKSIWWYSDVRGIGFRVVCDVPEGIITDNTN